MRWAGVSEENAGILVMKLKWLTQNSSKLFIQVFQQKAFRLHKKDQRNYNTFTKDKFKKVFRKKFINA